MDPQILVGLLILVIFMAGAVCMFFRLLPALLVLPLMGLGIAGGAALLTGQIGLRDDLLKGVLSQGSLRLHEAIIVAFFGGILSFIMQKSGVAQNLIKQAAELIGDNPLAVALFSMAFVALLFTSIGGLGAIIMVAMVFLPMMGTVGIPPLVAASIMLIGISIGGLLNPGNWVLYTTTLKVPVEQVRTFALISFGLTFLAGTVFVCIELYRAKAVRKIGPLVLALIGAAGGCALLVFAVLQSNKGTTARTQQLSVYTADYAGREFGPITPSMKDGVATFVLDPSAQDDQRLVLFNLPEGAPVAASFEFSARATAPVALQVALLTNTSDVAYRTYPVKAFRDEKVTVRVADFQGVMASEIKAVHIKIAALQKPAEPAAPPVTTTDPDVLATEATPTSPAPAVAAAAVADAAPAPPVVLVLGQPTLNVFVGVPILMTILRVVVGVGLLLLIGLIALDILGRTKRWRQQVVVVKWYAYLIPAIPLLLILVYNIDILAAFFFGFVYAILATLRPGSISLTIQSMIQGASAVMPAALLMIGIGILLTAILGPSGWEAARGMDWPVKAAIQPLLAKVVPTTAIGYVIFFGLLAPLALYRGPFNTWGLGFGIATLLATILPAPAVMAMLLTVGQIQGVCDPTNTQNVWLANEVRVDVQAILWRTLPYIWCMAILGLIISAVWFF